VSLIEEEEKPLPSEGLPSEDLNSLEAMLGQKLGEKLYDPARNKPRTSLDDGPLKVNAKTFDKLGRRDFFHKNTLTENRVDRLKEAEEASKPDKATDIARNMDVWFSNPWAMVEDGVIFTLDQVDMLNPIKRLPDKPWLQAICNYWLDSRLVLVPKSRRMMISWLMSFLHLHLAMFNEGINVFFVSDKEEKSDELVKRSEFILKYIPDDKMLKPKWKSSFCYLEFPGLNSSIQGVPMGADQLRQYTASAIMADEFAFWSKARDTYMSAIPTIQGGGRFTAISSPQVGFFKDLAFDAVR